MSVALIAAVILTLTVKPQPLTQTCPRSLHRCKENKLMKKIVA